MSSSDRRLAALIWAVEQHRGFNDAREGRMAESLVGAYATGFRLGVESRSIALRGSGGRPYSLDMHAAAAPAAPRNAIMPPPSEQAMRTFPLVSADITRRTQSSATWRALTETAVETVRPGHR